MVSKKLLTEAQASQYIGMSRSFLRQSRMDGIRINRTPGPAWIRVGTRSIRYSIDALDEWCDSFPTHVPNKGKAA